MRRVLIAGIIVCGLLPAAARAQDLLTDVERDAIQPGMLVATPTNSHCTGNFIFDGTGAQAGRHYMGIAAHCVEDKVGGPVADAEGDVFGHVALTVWPYDSYADDYAFIEIDPAFYPRVDPALAGHPGIPTGMLPAAGGATGDRVQFSGWGFVTDAKTYTREQRVAFLKSTTDRLWFAWGIVSNTDSGGPVVHLPTGGALGSVSNYCVPLPLYQGEGFEPGCTGWGPTIAGILADAAKRGFTAEVRTAAEGAPVVPPAPAPAPAPVAPPPSAPAPAAASPAPAAKPKKRVRCKTKKQRRTKRCRRARRR